ncbi:VOC family protein [Spartinivicinus ruber]|uniref:VOC family protein n=1 Tax=Spartinivicinus ruber TaxID=2683272 RepID=UPI0013D08AA4|nr:VOC family protein [Spartinivicinus ruber]
MFIEHINISTPIELLDKLKLFYCELFGLVEGYRPNFFRKGYWLYFDEKALIHLTESNKHYSNERQGYLDHIAFQATGLEEFIDKLREFKIKFNIEHLSDIGMTQLFFKDPAGIGVEVNFLHETI